MNIGKCFQCDFCRSLIYCRIGMSNRAIQRFQFSCPSCEERISFIFGAPCSELKGALEIIDFKRPSSGEGIFIDLHLDFPVLVSSNVDTTTPFLRVFGKIGLQACQHLTERLSNLDLVSDLKIDLQRIILHYRNGDVENLERSCDRIPHLKLKSYKQQDQLAAVYGATTLIASSFTLIETDKEISEQMPRYFLWLQEKHPEQTIAFFNQIIATGFIKQLHHESIKIYPRMLELETLFRPAFFYDYAHDEAISANAARISCADFDACSTLYKDVAEVFSRQLTLLAGINNLIKRGCSDHFDPSLKLTNKGRTAKGLDSLDSFSNLDLGNKVKYIDNCFYKIEESAIDNQLRNAIAHFKYKYHESTQIITFYPAKEGMRREKSIEVSLMEFVRKTLILFREVHNINHIIKATLYHRLLILGKVV